jgi:hypothetical protein
MKKVIDWFAKIEQPNEKQPDYGFSSRGAKKY